jgi:general secretion pathway protein G
MMTARSKRTALSVLGLIGLIIMAVGLYEKQILRSKESVLKINLDTLRTAIDQYQYDHKKASQTLQDLVSAGYLSAVPTDPITGNDQWRIVMEDAPSNPTDRGITDVASMSDRRSLEGSRYSEW